MLIFENISIFEDSKVRIDSTSFMASSQYYFVFLKKKSISFQFISMISLNFMVRIEQLFQMGSIGVQITVGLKVQILFRYPNRSVNMIGRTNVTMDRSQNISNRSSNETFLLSKECCQYIPLSDGFV